MRRWPGITAPAAGRAPRSVHRGPGNAEALAAQWSALHGHGAVPDQETMRRTGFVGGTWGGR
ncbi:MAG: hypothetical protein J0H91_14445, partial [Rhodospirillales bacterium]|nr:hypothetical protein [Rhodospirillales bacterium]